MHVCWLFNKLRIHVLAIVFTIKCGVVHRIWRCSPSSPKRCVVMIRVVGPLFMKGEGTTLMWCVICTSAKAMSRHPPLWVEFTIITRDESTSSSIQACIFFSNSYTYHIWWGTYKLCKYPYVETLSPLRIKKNNHKRPTHLSHTHSWFLMHEMVFAIM